MNPNSYECPNVTTLMQQRRYGFDHTEKMRLINWETYFDRDYRRLRKKRQKGLVAEILPRRPTMEVRGIEKKRELWNYLLFFFFLGKEELENVTTIKIMEVEMEMWQPIFVWQEPRSHKACHICYVFIPFKYTKLESVHHIIAWIELLMQHNNFWFGFIFSFIYF